MNSCITCRWAEWDKQSPASRRATCPKYKWVVVTWMHPEKDCEGWTGRSFEPGADGDETE